MSGAAKRLIGILISLTLFIGAIIIFSSLLIPVYREIQELRGEKISLENLLKAEEQSVVTASRLLAESRDFASLKDSLSLVLPLDENIPGLINQLQGIAKISGVAIESLALEQLPLKPAVKESVEPLGTIRVSLRLRGSYESVKLYLQFLETNIRIIDVNSLSVIGGAAKEPVLNYSLVVDTYYQR